MPTAAENLATTQTNLAQQAANISARLVELDAMPLDQASLATFSEGGMSYDWNGFRASLSAQLDGIFARIEGLAKAAQIVGGPFTVIGKAGDGQRGWYG